MGLYIDLNRDEFFEEGVAPGQRKERSQCQVINLFRESKMSHTQVPVPVTRFIYVAKWI